MRPSPAEHLQLRILALMADDRERTSEDVANALKAPRPHVSRALGMLRLSGKIEADKMDGNLPRIYRRAREVAP